MIIKKLGIEMDVEEVMKKDIKECIEEWRNKKKSEKLIKIIMKRNSCFAKDTDDPKLDL